jgi:hypothetical protein
MVSVNFSMTFYPLTTLQGTVTQKMISWVWKYRKHISPKKIGTHLAVYAAL